MSKHHKHHHKSHHNEAKKHEVEKAPEQNPSAPMAESEPKAEPKAEPAEASATEAPADEAEGQAGVFENVAELNGKKTGGHEPVSFIPPNEPMDHSAQASLDAHEAAQEDKDPSEVPQELSHKEILDGALAPTSPDSITKDLPDEGKNPDAAPEGESAPLDSAAPASDQANAGQEKTESAPDALTQPSSDGSALVEADSANAPHTDASGVDLNAPASTDTGATPSAE